jgi:hypothetical protein
MRRKPIYFITLSVVVCVILIWLFFYNMNIKNTSSKNEWVLLNTKNFEKELQDILEMQRNQWPLSILEKDCNNYTLLEAKMYCEEQQNLFSDTVNE